MNELQLKQYMDLFEKEIIIKNYVEGNKDIKIVKTDVPLNHGVQMQTPFGEFIEKFFEFDGFLVINYYGVFKFSTKLKIKIEESMKALEILKTKTPKIAMVDVIHFNSIKMGHVKKYAPKLFHSYPDFRDHLVKLRWKKI